MEHHFRYFWNIFFEIAEHWILAVLYFVFFTLQSPDYNCLLSERGVILLCYLIPVNILFFLLWLISWSNTDCHYGNDVYRLDHSITKTQKAILKAFDIDSNDAKAKINDLSMRLGYRTR